MGSGVGLGLGLGFGDGDGLRVATADTMLLVSTEAPTFDVTVVVNDGLARLLATDNCAVEAVATSATTSKVTFHSYVARRRRRPTSTASTLKFFTGSPPVWASIAARRLAS